jgi:hypothetical protein
LKKSAGGAALCALIALAALPAGTSARVTYPGPGFGVPFELKVSGVMQKQWQIPNAIFCEYKGTGSQTVTFRTAGWTRARVFSVDRLHSRRADFYELEADLPLQVTVTRQDNTTQVPGDSAAGCGPITPHACGGPRTITIPRIPVRVRNHVLELDLEQDGTPGALANAVDQLYPAGSNCRFPNAEDIVKSRVAWPGNRRFLRPGSRGSFTVRQGPITRTGSVTLSDNQQTWNTSEQYSASFNLRTRNHCRPVPRSVRRVTGYVCNARNGTVLAD